MNGRGVFLLILLLVIGFATFSLGNQIRSLATADKTTNAALAGSFAPYGQSEPQTDCKNLPDDNRVNPVCDDPEQSFALYCANGNLQIVPEDDGKGIFPGTTVSATKLAGLGSGATMEGPYGTTITRLPDGSFRFTGPRVDPNSPYITVIRCKA